MSQKVIKINTPIGRQPIEKVIIAACMGDTTKARMNDRGGRFLDDLPAHQVTESLERNTGRLSLA